MKQCFHYFATVNKFFVLAPSILSFVGRCATDRQSQQKNQSNSQVPYFLFHPSSAVSRINLSHRSTTTIYDRVDSLTVWAVMLHRTTTQTHLQNS